jgi:hypothetical protein
MRGCSGTAIKRTAVFFAAAIGLVGIAACHRASSNLSDPAKFKTAVHALRTDLTKVRHDLQRETRDASHGATGRGQPLCYNLKNNVNFVVLKTIRNFVVRAVTADRNNLQKDINHIRHDRSDFKKDLDDFLNNGVARPIGARHAIERITGKIILTKARGNRLISAINEAVRTAYQRGNAVAGTVSECSGDGPGGQIPRIALVN